LDKGQPKFEEKMVKNNPNVINNLQSLFCCIKTTLYAYTVYQTNQKETPQAVKLEGQ
jgi:hypothetical protein